MRALSSMGEVGKEPKPLRIIFCGIEFPGAEIYTRESLKKYPHLQVSSLFSGFGILEGFLLHLGWVPHLGRVMFANVLCCFSFLGKLARNGWVWSRWAPEIQIGQFWILIALVMGIFLCTLRVLSFLRPSFIQRWLGAD